jgi:hypothetical protein
MPCLPATGEHYIYLFPMVCNNVDDGQWISLFQMVCNDWDDEHLIWICLFPTACNGWDDERLFICFQWF